MIEMSQLEQLITIAKCGTISKAAEELLISQPGLTRSMQRLEEDLGLKLFDRTRNKVTLNENGLMAVEYAKIIINQREEMITQLQKHDRLNHTIAIGSCAPAPIWGLTYLLKQKEPEIEITTNLADNEMDLLDGLENKDYTMIVVRRPIKIRDYQCIPLFEEKLYLSVPPAHPLAPFSQITFADLDGQSILLLSRLGFWNEICQKMIPHSHLLYQDDINIFNEIRNASALPNFRSNITLIREADKNRIAIPITDDEAKVQYYAIYHKDYHKRLCFLTKAFETIDWLETKNSENQ